MQRKVLVVGAIVVAAGIGVPTTAIMAPGRSDSSDVAPEVQTPPRPRDVPVELGTPPTVDTDEPAPTDTVPTTYQVPPGTIQHDLSAPPPPVGRVTPRPMQPPLPDASFGPEPAAVSFSPGDLRPPPMPSEMLEPPDIDDH